jgi:putative transposase
MTKVLQQQSIDETVLCATKPDEVVSAIAELDDLIVQCRDFREARKAYAIKMIYQGYLYDEIQSILKGSRGSITGWKQAYNKNGIESLRLKYKGRKSYLTLSEREEVLSWLQSKNCWELGELEYKLAFEYDVVYLSKQSYYDLFSEAGISWKKTTKLNPKAEPEAVAEKKKRFKRCWHNEKLKSKLENSESY